MRKLFTALTISMFGISTFWANAIVNRQAPATTQHLKKDGTSDRRYKSDRVTNSSHLRKNGKPDMRYKSNNANAGKKKN